MPSFGELSREVRGRLDSRKRDGHSVLKRRTPRYAKPCKGKALGTTRSLNLRPLPRHLASLTPQFASNIALPYVVSRVSGDGGCKRCLLA